MLVDSNIIIYGAVPENGWLRQFIAQNATAVSAISCVEVLGFTHLPIAEKQHFEAFFRAIQVLPVSSGVIARATDLRQQRKMTLGDALIAATCLQHGLTLVTRNTKDFLWIAGLTVLDPFTLQPALPTP